MKAGSAIESWVSLIKSGNKTIKDVPEMFRNAVESKLVEKVKNSKN